MERKIKEISEENPEMENDQVVAVANSMCEKSCEDKALSINDDTMEKKDLETNVEETTEETTEESTDTTEETTAESTDTEATEESTEETTEKDAEETTEDTPVESETSEEATESTESTEASTEARTFSQADLDKIVADRVSRERRKFPYPHSIAIRPERSIIGRITTGLGNRVTTGLGDRVRH